MSDHPHTPGPWKAQESGSGMLSSTFITDPRGDIIASMMGSFRDNYDAELIVAAPEMLEALELGDSMGNNGPFLLRYAADLLRRVLNDRELPTANLLDRKAEAEEAAIAKATGKEVQP